MEPTLEPQATRRVRILARFALLWALILVGRLIHLQVYRHPELSKLATDQHTGEWEVQAPRGRICDSTGQILAISVPVESVFIDPQTTPDIDRARDLFSTTLGLDPEAIHEKMAAGLENSKEFVWIKRKITDTELSRLRELKTPWIQFRKETKRFYPKGFVGAHVVGAVDFEEQGTVGLERSLDSALRGEPGMVRFLRDAQQRGIEFHTLKEARPGQDIGLTIDERIQHMADRELARAVQAHGCWTGSAVVLNPHTGDILAMASYPSFDPNVTVRNGKELGDRVNHAISVPFEPGSVFKVITVAAGLETTNLTPETPIDCGPGAYSLFGRVIHDIHAYNVMPVSLVLAKSSNIGAIKVGQRIGEANFLDYILRFGFGRRTGIPLPAESTGVVHKLSAWRRTSIGSVAMGHEISATSLQLALAVSTISNGGELKKPRLILWRQNPGEARIYEPVQPGRSVLKPETSIQMRRMMEGVVLLGTGKAARIAGFSSGGKTGSAQIPDPVTKRYTHRYNGSFVGFAPVGDPKIVVAVTLNGASKYGGVVAAPVFQKVASEAMRILGVVPDLPPEEQVPPPPPREEEMADVAAADLALPDDLQGEPGDAAAVVETAAGTASYLLGPKAPDLGGKPLRVVMAECMKLGIELEYSGSGITREQHPPPGAVLAAGQKMRVVLGELSARQVASRRRAVVR